MLPLIGAIAFCVSFMAGLLGLGGAVLLIPAYLYIPPLFGVEALDAKSITGLTSLQVFTSSLLGAFMHRKRGTVDTRVVLTIGIPITAASLGGAFLSGTIDATIILGVFAAMAIAGAAFMLAGRREIEHAGGPVQFNRPLAVGIALGVGIFGGMAGAPGAFILAPLMMTVLKIPTRVTIGSTLGIVVMSSLAASLGKLATGQVPLEATAVAVLAALPGTWLGSRFSYKLPARTLRMALAVLIGAVGVQMLWKVFAGG